MATALANAHDRGSWPIPYREDRFEPAGHQHKKGFGDMVGGFLTAFSDLGMTIESITREDDRVAILARSDGTAPNGARYQNIYHFSFVMPDGKVYRVSEFFDPLAVLSSIEQLPQPA